MSGFTERIAVYIDVMADKASTSLKSFRAEIAAANGITGKLSAGFGRAKESISANAGALAMTAGTALVAFGVKAVDAFTSTAKAALDLAAATGLSVEQASRWIAVGDDFGVTADQLAGAVGKIAKDLDAEKWSKYGIATRDAAGQARDANDIMTDVLVMMSETTNETERARIGAELLGKGWGSVAPLLGHTRAEYEKMLASVEDGQVITDKEAKKSERMRLAQDKLTDALNEFTLAAGEAASGLAPLIEGIAKVVEKANQLGLIDSVIPPSSVEDVGSLTDMVNELAEAARNSGDAVKYLQAQGYTEEQALNLLKATAPALKEVGNAASDAADGLKGAKTVGDAAAKSFWGVTEALTELERILKELDAEDAALDLADQFDEVAEASARAWEETANGAEDAEAAQRDAARSLNDLKREVAEYATNVLKLPESRVTAMLAQIDAGSVAQVEAQLGILARAREATFYAGFSGGGPKKSTNGGAQVEGLDGMTRGGSSLNVSVTVNGVVTGAQVGQEIANALQAWFNDGGTADWARGR